MDSWISNTAKKEAEDADADADADERDEDSECDVAEDPDDYNTGVAANSNEGASHSKNTSVSLGRPGNGEKDTVFGETPQNGLVNIGKGFSPFISGNSKEDGTEIDESNSGETWVQGLMEGEFSDLSVEERLNALVALVGVAIEGNSIRVILEHPTSAIYCSKSCKTEMMINMSVFETQFLLEVLPFGTSENTRVVIDHGVVPIFVKLLGNVAGDSPKCRDLVLQHGALIPLLAQLNEHAKLSMLRNATWTLSNFCRGKPQPPFEQLEEVKVQDPHLCW